MYKGQRFIAIITARGGSRGIPKKNIKPLAGRPLLYYTIRAAQESRYLDEFLVSTDDPEIMRVARRYHAPVPFRRPAELATDSAKSIPVVLHALDWIKANQQREFDYALILQPTSPLRTGRDIDECIRQAVDERADSVMSMVELSDFSLPKLKRLRGELILPLVRAEGKVSAAKHELPEKVYKRNGAVYLTKISRLRRGDLFGKKSLAHVMPPERSVDINTLYDFLLADWLMRQIKAKKIKL